MALDLKERKFHSISSGSESYSHGHNNVETANWFPTLKINSWTKHARITCVCRRECINQL